MPEFPTGLTRPSGPTRTTLVVAAALIAPDGRICLQQRPWGKNHGGLWEFPGGKVEPGEHPRIALAREIAEELGVTLDPDSLVACGHADSAVEAGGAGLAILLYAARAWEGEARCLEGEAIGWYAVEAIPQLAMPPLDYPLAAQLEKLLSTGTI